MRKIFLFGSRSVRSLPTPPNDWIQRNRHNEFIVGDCYGGDFLFQMLLNSLGVHGVIYHIGKNPRMRFLKDIKKVGDFDSKQTDKDDAMIEDCTDAMCIWDGKSKGTKRNIDRLQALGKPCVVFRSDL